VGINIILLFTQPHVRFRTSVKHFCIFIIYNSVILVLFIYLQ